MIRNFVPGAQVSTFLLLTSHFYLPQNRTPPITPTQYFGGAFSETVSNAGTCGKSGKEFSRLVRSMLENQALNVGPRKKPGLFCCGDQV